MEHSGAAGHDPAEGPYAAAGLVRLNPAMLGYDEENTDPRQRGESLHRAQLLAGCLYEAAVILIDELFNDIATLSTEVCQGCETVGLVFLIMQQQDAADCWS